MRTSVNLITPTGRLITGYDYQNQAWVIDGVYKDCNHPQAGEMTIWGEPFAGCDCYGRAHAGEVCEVRGDGRSENNEGEGN